MSEILSGPVEVKQELKKLDFITSVEIAIHPDGLFSFRTGLKNYTEIPVELNERIPTNCWIFLIDVTAYKSKWAYYTRVGQFLFTWNIGHIRRINAGLSPVLHHETKEYDFPGRQWISADGKWNEEER